MAKYTTLTLLLFVAQNVSGFVVPASFRQAAPTPLAAEEAAAAEAAEPPKFEPLLPFLPAADPTWSVRGPIGEGDFVLTREGGPVKEELSNENLMRILMIECSDLDANTLVWKCLGYRFDAENEEWKPDEVFPKWREKYPSPPDFIGMQRIFSKEVDQPCLRANQSLVKSIPANNKQSLKKHLKPLGFTGYKVSEAVRE